MHPNRQVELTDDVGFVCDTYLNESEQKGKKIRTKLLVEAGLHTFKYEADINLEANTWTGTFIRAKTGS